MELLPQQLLAKFHLPPRSRLGRFDNETSQRDEDKNNGEQDEW